MHWFVDLIFALLGLMLIRELLASEAIRHLHKLGVNAYARNDRVRARKFWELAIGNRSLLYRGEWFKTETRFQLAGVLLELREPVRAMEQCSILLRQKLKPFFRAQVLDRYAESLLVQENEAGAAEAREMALQILADPRIVIEDAARLLLQAHILSEQMRYTEACRYYEQALKFLPRSQGNLRTKTMLELALEYYSAGQPERMVRWIEATLAESPQGETLFLAHRLAVSGYCNQGLLEQAEQHWEKERAEAERQEAERQGSTNQMARVHLSQGLILLKRGCLAEAYAEIQRALTIDAKTQYSVLILRSTILRIWGRFDEAVATLNEALKLFKTPLFQVERRSRARVWLALLYTECSAERPEEAWTALQQVRSVFEQDARLRLQCIAAEALIHALRKDYAAADACITSAELEMAELMQDRQVVSNCLSLLARAIMESGDFERALTYWKRVMDSKPDAVWKSGAWYYIGECHRVLGDSQAATEAYQQAVALGVDCYRSGLARQRLAEQTE